MNRYGKFHDVFAQWKPNAKNPLDPFKNNITRRNREISEGTHIITQKCMPDSLPPLWPPPTSRLFVSTAPLVD